MGECSVSFDDESEGMMGIHVCDDDDGEGCV